MSRHETAPRPFPTLPVVLAALWVLIAAAASAFTLHLVMVTIRGGDAQLSFDSAGLARMAESMLERGVSPQTVVSSVSDAAHHQGLEVDVHSLPAPPPETHQPDDHRQPDRIFIGGPPVGFSLPDATRSPAMMLHIGDDAVMLSEDGDPAGRIIDDYGKFMLLLLLVAAGTTWYVSDRTMKRALEPSQTIEAALRRLSSGEYAKLDVVGKRPDEAAIVDA